jgi:two-component system KDP operon response regulator KdpE
MQKKKKILVVDDEPQIMRVLRTSLSGSGYEVRTAEDGHAALRTVREWQPDLVITDISMPNMDGIELAGQLRAESQVPIIVLSVKGEENTKIAALGAGADDYVTKPVGMNELLARVRRNLSRVHAVGDTARRTLEIGDFRIDSDANRVLVKGRELRLSPKEFELLELFCKARRQSRDSSSVAFRDLGAERGRATRAPQSVSWAASKENRD